MDDPPDHPIGRRIHELLRRGSCARIFVDALREGVDVPDHVRESWGHELPLDLDPSWPLALAYDEEALYADLSFQTLLVRCRLPYRAIWGVIDPGTHLGAFFEENIPPEVEARLTKAAEEGVPVEPEAVAETPDGEPSSRPRLRVIDGGKK